MDKSLEERFPSFFRKSKTPVAWDILCEGGGDYFTLSCDNHAEYLSNLMERIGWDECYAVVTHYGDGTSSREEYETWN